MRRISAFSRSLLLLLPLMLLALVPGNAKETPFQTVDWPSTGPAAVRFTFAKFKQLTGGIGKEHGYVDDVTAENLSGTVIARLDLQMYVFDKTHVRIGEGRIELSNLGAGETVKFELTVYFSGTPASIELGATPPRTLSITVNSIPQGATLRVDGKDAGTTPKMIEVALGKHMLEFGKDGFNTGHFVLEMGPRDVSGGSVSYELGTSAKDTIELRDGSVLSGDLLAIDGMEVRVRIAGAVQTFDRNQVKRILLTEREHTTTAVPAANP